MVFDSKKADEKYFGVSKIVVVGGAVENEGILTVVISKDKYNNLVINKIDSIGGRNSKQIWSYIQDGLLLYDCKKKCPVHLAEASIASHISNAQEFSRFRKSDAKIRKYLNINKGLGSTALHPDTVAFNKAMLKAKREGVKPRQYIRLGETKGVLLNTLGEKQMRIAGATINKSMTKDSDHIMQWDNFINLPDYINNPIAIFKSKSIGYVVLTEVFNKRNKPLMIPLHVVKKGRFLELKSLYSKTDDKIYLDWVREGLLLYINKKSELLFKVFKGLIPSVDNNSHHKDTKKKRKKQKFRFARG